ncbi:MAG: hypothetical protein OXK78_03690, partial [Caldilineaceae bacterium]|nr:hypothetical protein [Caldilineaceae bacterium]
TGFGEMATVTTRKRAGTRPAPTGLWGDDGRVRRVRGQAQGLPLQVLWGDDGHTRRVRGQAQGLPLHGIRGDGDGDDA